MARLLCTTYTLEGLGGGPCQYLTIFLAWSRVADPLDACLRVPLESCRTVRLTAAFPSGNHKSEEQR